MSPLNQTDLTPTAIKTDRSGTKPFNISILILLWYAAACLDCGNLSQAEIACKDKFIDQNNCDDCDCAGTSVYGTTIGIDFLCLFPLILITFCKGENGLSGNKASLASQSQQV